MKHFFKTTATALLLALLLSGGAGAARTEFLIPGGETIGLQLQFDGISVVEFAESNPCAKEAGLKKGDLICKIDGAPVTTTQELSDAVNRSEGRALRVTVRRGAEEKTFRFAPQNTKDGWRLGLYVRDGINGIGTVTYYEPATGAFGALGHGVGEGGGLPPLRSGSVFDAQIVSVARGKAGEPGALHPPQHGLRRVRHRPYPAKAGHPGRAGRGRAHGKRQHLLLRKRQPAAGL